MGTLKINSSFVVAGVLCLVFGISYLVLKNPDQFKVDEFRFAVIGDFGFFHNHDKVKAVSELVKSWKPDFIATTGDNNYPSGEAATIDSNIGVYYSEFIYPYVGAAGEGSHNKINRFFPALGNHDLRDDDGQSHFDYFHLPGNERYYDIQIGMVHLVIVSSSRDEDGNSRNSIQGQWARSVLKASKATWKIVLIHHPPYSSGHHGSNRFTRWPYKEWGATTVISGHDHLYERLESDGFPYFVNGLGGVNLRGWGNISDRSVARYNDDYGAMRVSGNGEKIKFEFINIQNQLIDELVVAHKN